LRDGSHAGRRYELTRPAPTTPRERARAIGDASDALLWQAGDGEVGAEDRVRKQLSGEAGARVNVFFRDLYRDTSHLLAGLQANGSWRGGRCAGSCTMTWGRC
jgi:hypothetical protein